MKHATYATIAAALSLPLLAACGSPAATHPASPPAATGAVQCSRLHAAQHQISTDAYAEVVSVPRMLAIVAIGKAAGWERMLKHAAAVPGPATRIIILAGFAAATLKLEATLVESGAGTGQPVVKPWKALTGALRDAAAACKRTERG